MWSSCPSASSTEVAATEVAASSTEVAASSTEVAATSSPSVFINLGLLLWSSNRHKWSSGTKIAELDTLHSLGLRLSKHNHIYSHCASFTPSDRTPETYQKPKRCLPCRATPAESVIDSEHTKILECVVRQVEGPYTTLPRTYKLYEAIM
eukprot:GHVR01021187.1.p1 GENE.GHVR01021187.1~~GHVR01021187.1.p1  ORF type:complete len:150 (-),score=26.13 GHVR01021187.1:120-569(-)